MATKRTELRGLQESDIDFMVETTALPPGCFAKADMDEPLFILRGQDRCAPFAVRAWADRAKAAGSLPEKKYAEAMDLAGEMERWQEEHPTRAKFPD